MKYILASQSPQRREILEKLGIDFEVIPSNFDESQIAESDPIERAKMLARAKAEVIAQKNPDRWVIGVDTLVVSADGELLEKPVDAADAERMLTVQSGRVSTVHSALCLIKNDVCRLEASTARVTFRELSDEDVAWWINSGLWRERSGGFQIDGEGHRIIEHLEGEFETVVGFPVALFAALLQEVGIC